MSCHLIYYEDGAKKMRPIHSREEYLALRNGGEQAAILAAVRSGDESRKKNLVQFNYSCLPNDDGTLRGSKRMSTTVAMDIDHVPAEEMVPLKERILQKKDELGLYMLEESARGMGYHLVFARKPELSQEDNLKWASELLGVEYDKGAKDITRVFYTTTEKQLVCLDDAVFAQAPAPLSSRPSEARGEISDISVGDVLAEPNGKPGDVSTTLDMTEKGNADDITAEKATAEALAKFDMCVKEAGLDPNKMDVWGVRNWHSNLLAVLSVGVGKLMDREQLEAVVAKRAPNYWPTQDCKNLIKYFYANYNTDVSFMNAGLREINAKAQQQTDDEDSEMEDNETEDNNPSNLNSQLSIRKLPQGVKDSINAAGPSLAMPMITAICPCIGALATGVKLDVHGQMRGLNLISYIAGDFASGKGSIDPVIDTWMSEVKALDDMYQTQEEEYRRKKKAAQNQKTQPEEPKLPVRYVTFNTTVANLAERLANVEGKHAFSFTPEADIVAQKWKSSMCDFSVMLRQSYDGSRYDREARSAEAVNVHIKHLLWNVTMCGTPDALYRVVTNYTDGFQSRIALAQTPDNTFAKLEDKPYVLTSKQAERIQQIAHLLPLMNGEVVLPKLEARGREWLEKIRLEAMMNDDRVKARERFRTCVTTQRMVCCLMLCKVCEQLIQKHGLVGAETQLKQHPNLWKELLLKAQTSTMLDMYDVIADSLLEKALYFFRDRIENAFRSRDYAGINERKRLGKNDTIYERLDMDFSFEMALQHSVNVNGAGVSRNQVHQMLKNWKKQGLIIQAGQGMYKKIQVNCH